MSKKENKMPQCLACGNEACWANATPFGYQPLCKEHFYGNNRILKIDYADPNNMRQITEEEGEIIALYNDLEGLFKDKSIKDKDEMMKQYYDKITPLFDKLFESQLPDDPYYKTLDIAKKNLIFFWSRVASIFEHKELQ